MEESGRPWLPARPQPPDPAAAKPQSGSPPLHQPGAGSGEIRTGVLGGGSLRGGDLLLHKRPPPAPCSTLSLISPDDGAPRPQPVRQAAVPTLPGHARIQPGLTTSRHPCLWPSPPGSAQPPVPVAHLSAARGRGGDQASSISPLRPTAIAM
ncbi:uncharacterized protein KIAA1522-like [Triticum aestivum]|uniref:uncharacterized protein KIAA1522-like n=1 Tax=Triticum aestivum TaxID=4565 RepID=UPI001D0087E6|nr:uncharacterized protein KIAA1522-like [Triticum aestivum]